MRAAVGDDRLYYLGFSYGTYLGAIYADLFPSRVGRMVLDGVLDPSLNMNQVSALQASGFEASLREFVTECQKQHAKQCPLHR
ncbi:Tripeptidyl aminopeptidase precursor [Mobiluncus curtisii]|uniref:Tripeptidyl aminopeptidase n=2 Tax=Mobiluncus curtisii TaxID=2051 RepID=A0A2X3B8R1_9ACTO|nr:Tripeptidyl aminopeptidase precursor [Mobiluncus curtisii]